MKLFLVSKIRRLRRKRPLRVIFISNRPNLPTLDICLLQPLSHFIEAGEILSTRLTESHLKSKKKLKERLCKIDPDLIVLCRYSGHNAAAVTDWAKKHSAATVFHIDDDLLNIPMEFGLAKFNFHNAPKRLETVRHLLSETDLVYCSTQTLRDAMAGYGFSKSSISGAINASAPVLSPARWRNVQKIGYMGFDHGADLQMISWALVKYLQEFPSVTFEMFGSIPLPSDFDQFSDRIVTIPPVRGYQDFLKAFAEREWDIGICPLLPTPFNSRKSNLKWIEYTAVGAAVVASAGTIYDECCSDGCGILASNNEEWLAALRKLTLDPEARFGHVSLAQKRLEESYSRERHSRQVVSVFSDAFNRAGVKAPKWNTEPV